MSEEDAVDVLAVVAHRLLGGVAAVRGVASLLTRPDLPDDRRIELATLLCEEAVDLEALVRGLLRGEVPAAAC